MTKYYAQRMLTVLTMLFAIVFLPVTGKAQDALQRIPKNALGFAVVQNLTEASAKFEQLLEPFDVTFPAPLTFAKLVIGLDAGFDASGDLVIALLPGEASKADAQPMVLLPITRYEQFAASVHADTSGEICRITLLGEDILVARIGTHALLMNVEHRTTMEKILLRTEKPLLEFTPISSWLTKQDVALVLMPKGIEALSHLQRQPARRRRSGFDIVEQRSVLSQLLSEVSSTEIHGWLHRNVELAAIGVLVDEQLNVRLGEQFLLKESSPLAGLASQAIQRDTAKLGLSNEPFVFTAGGPVAPGWGKQFSTLLRKMEQKSAAEYGLKNIASGLWDKEERAYQLLFEDVSNCSVVMLTGEKGEPLVGNFLGMATVPDVTKYFDSLPQVVETWNKLTQQSTSDLKPDFELTTEEVDGKRRCEMIIDIGSTMRDPNVPLINWILEAAFGLEGKLHFQFIQINSTTFAFGLATEQQMSKLLAAEQQNIIDVPQSPEMQSSLDLLKPNTPWRALISPQGCLRWTSRFCNEYLVLFSEQEVTIPDMPATPPVGMTIDWNDRHWECELVCPAATWKALGEYVETFNHQ